MASPASATSHAALSNYVFHEVFAPCARDDLTEGVKTGGTHDEGPAPRTL